MNLQHINSKVCELPDVLELTRVLFDKVNLVQEVRTEEDIKSVAKLIHEINNNLKDTSFVTNYKSYNVPQIYTNLGYVKPYRDLTTIEEEFV